jgi:diadenosine tetraphosphate (Ap4A) HIT family hydrolase
MPCPFCELIPELRAGKQECLAELDESFVILAYDQFYPGYSILVLKDHEEQLVELSAERQARLWRDVARVAGALKRVLNPARINYECLGNMVNHIHWHVVPRYADDQRRHEPIWLRPEAERRGTMTAEQRADVVGRLRRALGS